MTGSGKDKAASGSPFFLLRWLRQIWDVHWGERLGTNRVLGVLSASAGLFFALVVGAVELFQRQGFYQSVSGFLEGSAAAALGLSALAAVALAAILALAVIVAVATFGGMIIYLSSSPQSYLTYAWRGALVLIVAIALYAVGWTIMSLPEMMG